MRGATPFFQQLHARVMELGGLFNAHLHLDRSGTLDATRTLLEERDRGLESRLSLAAKHSLIPAIHASPCYEPVNLTSRVEWFLDRMVEAGTTRAATVIDTTADSVGLAAVESLLRIRDARRGSLDLAVGAYSPLGFRNDEPERWSLLEEGARLADFIGLLPERDDRRRYPEHVGFEECCRRALLLAAEMGKELHIHVDQMNHPAEMATETVVRIVDELELGSSRFEAPRIWLVHVISPSTYDEPRFARLRRHLEEDRAEVARVTRAA